MRQGTLILLISGIVLFAIFGAAFLKFVALAIGLFVLFLFGSILVAGLLLRRRMRRKMAQFQQAFQAAQQQAQAQHQAQQRRREAIDVDPVDVRDDR